METLRKDGIVRAPTPGAPTNRAPDRTLPAPRHNPPPRRDGGAVPGGGPACGLHMPM
jgi:hypothetical protein